MLQTTVAGQFNALHLITNVECLTIITTLLAAVVFAPQLNSTQSRTRSCTRAYLPNYEYNRPRTHVTNQSNKQPSPTITPKLHTFPWRTRTQLRRSRVFAHSTDTHALEASLCGMHSNYENCVFHLGECVWVCCTRTPCVSSYCRMCFHGAFGPQQHNIKT